MSSEIRVQRICEHCAEAFEAKTTVTRFCSDYCAKRAYKLRKRKERLEASEQETRQMIRRPVAEIQARDFLSVEDVCDLFGVSRSTVWRLCKAKRVQSAKVGRKRFILRASIDQLFKD